MFSYGESNKVRFDKAQGIIGIFAPNASGKSSLWDALSFCIYDKTSRTNSAKNILNNQKDNFYCKFNFEIDGVDYFIERSARWTRKGTNLSVNVNFWKEDAGVTTSLNGEQRRDTNKNIERYLGKFANKLFLPYKSTNFYILKTNVVLVLEDFLKTKTFFAN